MVRHGFKHMLKEFPGCLPVGFIDGLGHGELARAIDADEYSLPSAVCTSAMSMWKKPIG